MATCLRLWWHKLTEGASPPTDREGSNQINLVQIQTRRLVSYSYLGEWLSPFHISYHIAYKIVHIMCTYLFCWRKGSVQRTFFTGFTLAPVDNGVRSVAAFAAREELARAEQRIWGDDPDTLRTEIRMRIPPISEFSPSQVSGAMRRRMGPPPMALVPSSRRQRTMV